MYDYQFWSPSAFIQKRIGASKAITFEINNGCNASNMGLFISSNLLVAQDSWKFGLIIVSDTLSKFVNYSEKSSFPLFSFSDGTAKDERYFFAKLEVSSESHAIFVRVPFHFFTR